MLPGSTFKGLPINLQAGVKVWTGTGNNGVEKFHLPADRDHSEDSEWKRPLDRKFSDVGAAKELTPLGDRAGALYRTGSVGSRHLVSCKGSGDRADALIGEGVAHQIVHDDRAARHSQNSRSIGRASMCDAARNSPSCRRYSDTPIPRSVGAVLC